LTRAASLGWAKSDQSSSELLTLLSEVVGEAEEEVEGAEDDEELLEEAPLGSEEKEKLHEASKLVNKIP
jgi:hypothetical protein